MTNNHTKNQVQKGWDTNTNIYYVKRDAFFFIGVLAPLIAMTKEVTLKYPDIYNNNGMAQEAQTCYVDMEPDVKKLYFTIMGMLFYGITAIVSVAFLSCTICKAMSVDLENYFIKDDFKNHVSFVVW